MLRLSVDDKVHTVYWVKIEGMKDPYKEGYIGVTSNLKQRIKRHESCCNAFDKSYKDEFISEVNNKNHSVEVLFTGSKDFCYEKEYEFRPNYNIGWNTRCGSSPYLKLRDEKVSSAYRSMRYNAKTLGLRVCEEWKTTQGFLDFQEFYEGGVQGGLFEMRLPKSGIVSRETVVFVSRKDMVRGFNRNINFFGDGELYSTVELAELLNIEKPNTLATQRKRGWSSGKIFMKAWSEDRLKNNVK